MCLCVFLEHRGPFALERLTPDSMRWRLRNSNGWSEFDGAASVSEFTTCGFGIRVLIDGQWGFASDNLSQQQPSETVRKAISLARAMPRRTRTVMLAEVPPVQASYETHCEQDPFDKPVPEKVEMVRAIMQAMAGASDKVSKTQAKLDFRREASQLVTSEGTEIGQTITLTGLDLGALLAGSVITETIFAWPGIGRLAVNAIYGRDYPVVQATVLVVASIYEVINFLVDLSYAFLNPRVRLY